ncbi:MAG TPA: hypothetical protein VFU74_06775 [Actinocrinis sp.]|nr:hypothetical protein [Actinocrinis sp.]
MPENDRTALVRSLARRIWMSALIIAVAAGAGFGYGTWSARTYTAQSFLVAVPQVAGDTASATAFATAYSRLATQPAVLAQASATTAIPAETLRGAISAATSPDAPVISITGSAHDPAAAAADANAVAGALAALASAHVADTSVRLTVLAAATAPTQPSSPSVTLDTALGAAAGLLLASLAALAGGAAGGRRREEGESEPATDGAAAQPPLAAAPVTTAHANRVAPFAERTVP